MSEEPSDKIIINEILPNKQINNNESIKLTNEEKIKKL